MSLEKFIPIKDESTPIPEGALPEASSCASSEPYVLMVLGDSMAPEFNEGDIIVIEPAGVARHESFVIAYHNEEYTFRQLLIEEGRFFIKALNPDYPTEELAGLESVKGVISQKKTPGGGRRNRKSYV